MDGKNRLVWRLLLHPDGSLFAVVVKNRRKGQEAPGALYRSIDQAATWLPVPLPAGVDFPSDLSCDTKGRLYLAAWPRLEKGRNRGGGAWASDDGGRTWKPVLDQGLHVVTVTVDQARPQRLCAGTFDAALFASEDAGRSWRKIEPFDFQWGYRPVLDPHNTDMVYLTTFGSSVWHGPVGGASP